MEKLTSVTKHIDFDAAHVLPEGYNGKCRNLHGHTYKAYVTLTGPRNSSEFGMVVDFKLLVITSIILTLKLPEGTFKILFPLLSSQTKFSKET